MEVFKIINRATGFFSKGGIFPTFDKTGKLWTSKRNLRLHLSMFNQRERERYYTNCEVITYEMYETSREKIVPQIVENSQLTFEGV